MNAPADARILVVDDDDGGRYVKAHTLARQGYRVVEAALAETAIEIVAKEQPDLVLLDVRLPDGNGVQVCRRLKAEFPNVTVLQTSSAQISAQDRAHALEAGADSYLVEPIEPDELVAVVRALLRMRHAEQALRDMNESLEQRVIERTGELAESQRLLRSEQAGRREVESVLWHAQKLEAIGRLTGGIAHDFNNLLTVISGNLELLETALTGERERSPAAQLRLVTSAIRAVEHGAQMTQQLLAFARRGVLQSKVIDINAVIAGMADFLSRTLGDAITFKFAKTPGLWLCRIDPVQFEAAILNLAINARDAMPEGGTLTIALSNFDTRDEDGGSGVSPGRYACVRVVDTGVGMTQDVIERAFEPFFTTKNVGEGSGLGLSQVYGFVNQSGGDVNITSTPGNGTTVALYLPHCEDGRDNDGETINFGAGGGKLYGSETILIVEDDEMVRDIAVTMVSDLGYRVLVAANGADALEVLRGSEHIDLLFSDIVMPGGIGGLALATEARQIREELKVLLTSGYPARDGSRPVGPSQFPMITKPYQRDQLASVLRGILDPRQPPISGIAASAHRPRPLQ